MKKLLGIVVLCLLLTNLSQADDIRDFQIEGMSIGDSLLNYFSKEKIINAPRYDNTNTIRTSDKFYEARIKDSKQYAELVFALKKNDQTFKIYMINGVIKYANNISECYKKIENIANDLDEIFTGAERTKSEVAHKGDPTGKSKITSISFTLDSKDRINVQCYDWTKKMRYYDNLRVGIFGREYREWLHYEAYK